MTRPHDATASGTTTCAALVGSAEGHLRLPASRQSTYPLARLAVDFQKEFRIQKEGMRPPGLWHEFKVKN